MRSKPFARRRSGRRLHQFRVHFQGTNVFPQLRRRGKQLIPCHVGQRWLRVDSPRSLLKCDLPASPSLLDVVERRTFAASCLMIGFYGAAWLGKVLWSETSKSKDLASWMGLRLVRVVVLSLANLAPWTLCDHGHICRQPNMNDRVEPTARGCARNHRRSFRWLGGMHSHNFIE